MDRTETSPTPFHGLPPEHRAPVERLQWGAGPGAWKTLFARRTPALLTGYARDFGPALEKWTFPYLRQQVGEKIVRVGVLRDAGLTKLDYTQGSTTEVAISDLLTRIEAQASRKAENGDVYLTQGGCFSGTTSALRPLWNDVVIPPTPRPLFSANLWIGSGGNTTYLHFDPFFNILTMLRGRKHLVLVSPKQSSQVYPTFAIGDDDPLGSSVDLRDPDFDHHPGLRTLAYLEVSIGPGESLYLPPGWWHYVVSEDVNVAVNVWWRTSLADWLTVTPMRGLVANRLSHPSWAWRQVKGIVASKLART